MYSTNGFVLFICLLGIHAQEQPKNYTAVVTEYEPSDSVNDNTGFYEMLIFTAESVRNVRADIIVFPGRTLTESTKDAVFVPNPEDKILPHKNATFDSKGPMYRISKAAAKSKIYTVINIFEKVKCTNTSNCPDRGYFLYDTNVAFDRQGMVIARYRKYNTYYGSQVDKPKIADLTTFTTDFGVTFGMFIGFDILFKTPAMDLVQEKNIKHFVFPSRWPGDYPFLTALQVQDGWSYAMNVNVLASGANDIDTGCSGTGIYVARQNRISAMYEREGTSYMYWGVPKKLIEAAFVPGKVNQRRLIFTKDPSIPYSQGKDLDPKTGKFQDKICHGKFCCNFDIKYRMKSNSPSDKYRVVAFQGLRPFGEYVKQEVAYCALLLCPEGDCTKRPGSGYFPLEFDDIKISAEFQKSKTLQFPSTLVSSFDQDKVKVLDTMQYDHFTFVRKEITAEDKVNIALNLKQANKGDIITFGIYNRKFD